MKPLSLKAHVLVGAVLWTIGLFALTGVFLHLVTFDHSSIHAATHSAGPAVSYWSYWLFFQHGPAAALVGGLFMLFGYLQIRRGLVPISELRHRLVAVHKGVDGRVGGRYPVEVQPLVDDLNALLDEREDRVSRAVAKAGDLAHGLKTPLAVLAHEAQQARAAGHEPFATEIDKQIDRMRRQIDYHLAHTRSAASSASGAVRATVVESAEGLVRVLQRLHAGRSLRIEIDAPASCVFRGQREDLDEMLGNLLDNACKWARTRVRLTCSKEDEQIVLTVDDDGPGIELAKREAVTRRRVRADEAVEGSGLGLAIVRDLAEVYAGSVSLEESPIGGTRARLTLPAQGVLQA